MESPSDSGQFQNEDDKDCRKKDGGRQSQFFILSVLQLQITEVFMRSHVLHGLPSEGHRFTTGMGPTPSRIVSLHICG